MKYYLFCILKNATILISLNNRVYTPNNQYARLKYEYKNDITII